MAERYIPEHRRTQFKAKNTFKPEELRRRREEQQVEIRKAKREENLAKRRGLGTGENRPGASLGAAPDSDDDTAPTESQVCKLLHCVLTFNFSPGAEISVPDRLLHSPFCFDPLFTTKQPTFGAVWLRAGFACGGFLAARTHPTCRADSFWLTALDCMIRGCICSKRTIFVSMLQEPRITVFYKTPLTNNVCS